MLSAVDMDLVPGLHNLRILQQDTAAPEPQNHGVREPERPLDRTSSEFEASLQFAADLWGGESPEEDERVSRAIEEWLLDGGIENVARQMLRLEEERNGNRMLLLLAEERNKSGYTVEEIVEELQTEVQKIELRKKHNALARERGNARWEEKKKLLAARRQHADATSQSGAGLHNLRIVQQDTAAPKRKAPEPQNRGGRRQSTEPKELPSRIRPLDELSKVGPQSSAISRDVAEKQRKIKTLRLEMQSILGTGWTTDPTQIRLARVLVMFGDQPYVDEPMGACRTPLVFPDWTVGMYIVKQEPDATGRDGAESYASYATALSNLHMNFSSQREILERIPSIAERDRYLNNSEWDVTEHVLRCNLQAANPSTIEILDFRSDTMIDLSTDYENLQRIQEAYADDAALHPVFLPRAYFPQPLERLLGPVAKKQHLDVWFKKRYAQTLDTTPEGQPFQPMSRDAFFAMLQQRDDESDEEKMSMAEMQELYELYVASGGRGDMGKLWSESLERKEWRRHVAQLVDEGTVPPKYEEALAQETSAMNRLIENHMDARAFDAWQDTVAGQLEAWHRAQGRDGSWVGFFQQRRQMWKKHLRVLAAQGVLPPDYEQRFRLLQSKRSKKKEGKRRARQRADQRLRAIEPAETPGQSDANDDPPYDYNPFARQSGEVSLSDSDDSDPDEGDDGAPQPAPGFYDGGSWAT